METKQVIYNTISNFYLICWKGGQSSNKQLMLTKKPRIYSNGFIPFYNHLDYYLVPKSWGQEIRHYL